MKTIAAVIVALLFSPALSVAQAGNPQPASGNAAMADDPPASNPARPPEIGPAIARRTMPSQHHFFDAKNAFATGAFAVGLAGDSWSTQRALSYPGTSEANPLARPFVSSRAGEAVYSGTSLGLMVGGMYLAHKTHHHKLERVVPWVMAGWEVFLTSWNLHQISRVR